MNIFGQVLTTTAGGHIEPVVGGGIFAVGKCAANEISCVDTLDGNELLESISCGRRAGLRLATSMIIPGANGNDMQSQHVPVTLLYKEKFEPLQSFSHKHHTTSTPCVSSLHCEMDAVSANPQNQSGVMHTEQISPDMDSSEPEHNTNISNDAKIDNCDSGSDSRAKFRGKKSINGGHSLHVFSFALPSLSSEMRVGVGEGISIRVTVNNQVVVRRYTPVQLLSTGVVNLYLRTRAEHGSMSNALHYLKPGYVIFCYLLAYRFLLPY